MRRPLSLRRFVEAGTRIPLNSEIPSHGLSEIPSPRRLARPGDTAQGLNGRSHGASARLGACAAHWLSGTVRDYGQGLGIRGQLLDWPRQGPVPGPCHICAHITGFGRGPRRQPFGRRIPRQAAGDIGPNRRGRLGPTDPQRPLPYPAGLWPSLTRALFRHGGAHASARCGTHVWSW